MRPIDAHQVITKQNLAAHPTFAKNLADISDLKDILDDTPTLSLCKLLSLDEVLSSSEPCVFLETKDSPKISAVLCAEGDNEVIVYFLRKKSTTLKPNKYGKTWRCWSGNPTDKERSSFIWEE